MVTGWMTASICPALMESGPKRKWMRLHAEPNCALADWLHRYCSYGVVAVHALPGTCGASIAGSGRGRLAVASMAAPIWATPARIAARHQRRGIFLPPTLAGTVPVPTLGGLGSRNLPCRESLGQYHQAAALPSASSPEKRGLAWCD